MRVGALAYCDGANLNAIMGKSRPGDMGFDAMHINLHKTFRDPTRRRWSRCGSGRGHPRRLAPYLPGPLVGARRRRVHPEHTRATRSGRVRSFVGNFGVLVRAYT